jgi:hypothetical protein
MYLLVIRIIVTHSTRASHQVAANISNETSSHSSWHAVTLPRLSTGERGVRGIGGVRGRGEKRVKERKTREEGGKQD